MSEPVASLTLPDFLTPPQITRERENVSRRPSTVEEKPRVYRDDPALVEACRRGDKNAWHELVDKYGRLVYSIARRDGLSEVDADDVFQIVFTIALRQLPTLRNQTCLSGWLGTIAHWQSLRLIRRTRAVSEIDETSADEGASVPDQVRRWERQEMVHQAIDRLDPRSRELIYQLFFESPSSYTEIAAHIGVPLGSIGPTRARCFKKLRKILSHMHIDLDF